VKNISNPFDVKLDVFVNVILLHASVCELCNDRTKFDIIEYLEHLYRYLYVINYSYTLKLLREPKNKNKTVKINRDWHSSI